MALPQWAYAALAAALASAFGMTLGRNKALSWRAWKPMLSVLIFDVAAGISASGVVTLVYHFTSNVPPIWSAVSSGIIGPGLLRARSPKFLSGKVADWRLFGALRELQEKAESDIDRICTGAETNRLDAVVSRLTGLTLEQIAEWVIRYISRSDRNDWMRRDAVRKEEQRRRRRAAAQVQSVREDEATEEVVRRKTIVQILLDAEGYSAVHSLVLHARAANPKSLVRRRTFPRRSSLGALRKRLRLPTGFRVDALEGRIRIGHPDRRIDEELLDLAARLKAELGVSGEVEGVYEGWIVLRPMGSKKARRGCAQLVNRLVTGLQGVGAAESGLVYQREGVVSSGVFRVYATAALVVSVAGNAPSDAEFCDDAFDGGSVRLVGELAMSDDEEDVRIYKAKMYAISGVLLYLLVDVKRHVVTLHSDPSSGKYERSNSVELGDMLTLPAPFGFDLDTSLPLEEPVIAELPAGSSAESSAS